MIRLRISELTEEEKRKLYTGMARASKYARKLAQENASITEDLIKQLHRTIFKDVFLPIAGIYRRGPIQTFENGHQPPPSEQIPERMRNFVLDVQERSKYIQPVHLVGSDPEKADDLATAVEHVAELAAFVHWRLVWIHPFTDGNGRTARILTNFILEKYSLRPISTLVDLQDKETYLFAQREADKHNLDPLAALIFKAEYEELEKHGVPWVAT